MNTPTECEITRLRTTIADLEKRLENAVEIDWEKAPDKAVSVAWAYVDKISAFIPDGDFKFHFIPRPTPAKLTPEQMANAYEDWLLGEMGAGYTAEDARDCLFQRLIHGKSIETLYAEIKGGE